MIIIMIVLWRKIKQDRRTGHVTSDGVAGEGLLMVVFKSKFQEVSYVPVQGGGWGNIPGRRKGCAKALR